jgi:aryl-alcohol dehydrogenase-like predicted oxidoreductase
MVSEIGLGALEIGRDWGIRIEGDFGRPPEDEAIRLIHTALDMGINFIDTAPAYQLSEERIGRALKDYPQKAIIATKVGEHYDDERGFWYDYGPEAVRTSIEQSLRRLRTDTIDLLQIHSASVEIVERGEVMEVMQRFQQAGHVRFLGMSGDDEAALAAIRDGRFDTVQVVYNIFEQGAAHAVLPAALLADVGVIVMAPLGHGTLTRKYEYLDETEQERVRALRFLVRPDQTLAQAALRFVLANEAVSSTIPGTRKIENLRSNAEAPSRRLEPGEVQRLQELFGGERAAGG